MGIVYLGFGVITGLLTINSRLPDEVIEMDNVYLGASEIILLISAFIHV